jgi:Tfp pilus assembly protein PilN
VLRTNLSTRPFYNERAVHALLGLVAAVVLAVSAWQVHRIVTLSRHKTELNASVARDRNEVANLDQQAANVRRGLNQQDLKVIAAEAKEANQLIAQRTFSWTALFNELESTLPPDVMLISIHPEIKDGRTNVAMEIQGRRTEDIVDFFDRLEKTGHFHDVTWAQETITDEGLHRMTMTAVYAAQPPGGRS